MSKYIEKKYKLIKLLNQTETYILQLRTLDIGVTPRIKIDGAMLFPLVHQLITNINFDIESELSAAGVLYASIDLPIYTDTSADLGSWTYEVLEGIIKLSSDDDVTLITKDITIMEPHVDIHSNNYANFTLWQDIASILPLLGTHVDVVTEINDVNANSIKTHLKETIKLATRLRTIASKELAVDLLHKFKVLIEVADISSVGFAAELLTNLNLLIIPASEQSAELTVDLLHKLKVLIESSNNPSAEFATELLHELNLLLNSSAEEAFSILNQYINSTLNVQIETDAYETGMIYAISKIVSNLELIISYNNAQHIEGIEVDTMVIVDAIIEVISNLANIVIDNDNAIKVLTKLQTDIPTELKGTIYTNTYSDVNLILHTLIESIEILNSKLNIRSDFSIIAGYEATVGFYKEPYSLNDLDSYTITELIKIKL